MIGLRVHRARGDTCLLTVGIDNSLVNFPARRIEHHDHQTRLIVKMSVPQHRRKFLTVLNGFTRMGKAPVKAIECVLAGFHIEEVCFQHFATVRAMLRRRLSLLFAFELSLPGVSTKGWGDHSARVACHRERPLSRRRWSSRGWSSRG